MKNVFTNLSRKHSYVDLWRLPLPLNSASLLVAVQLAETLIKKYCALA